MEGVEDGAHIVAAQSPEPGTEPVVLRWERKGGLQSVGACEELSGQSVIGPSTAESIGPTAGKDGIMGEEHVVRG